MLNSFKEKLINVQGNLSATIRGISVHDYNLSSSGQVIHNQPLNLKAGTEVLARFQNNWAEIHAQAVDNAKKADAADALIEKLHRKIEVDWRTARQASAVLTKIPQIILEVDLLVERLGRLDDLIVAVEKSLINFENLIETRQLQDKQLEERFQLALYKEKKLGQLENVRVILAREHAEKVSLHEARQQRVKKERQEAFEQQFKQDLSFYKETHNIPKVTLRNISQEGTKLEEVVLDSDDPAALDEFLEIEESTDDLEEGDKI